MAKYAINDTTLQGIGDEVRTLNGTAAALSPNAMKNGVAAANEEVNTQAALIDQIAAAMMGKAAGSGGGDEVAASIVDRTITAYSNKKLKTVGTRAFSHCGLLETVDLPEVTSIGQHGFNSCGKLRRVEFPKLTTLTPGDNFTYCYALEYADLGFVSNLPSWCLANNNKLATLILRKTDAICTLQTTNALSGTPIASGTGYIYVPRAWLSDDDETKDYRRATNWSTYAQFRALEDYTVDGTITGALDEAKIAA